MQLYLGHTSFLTRPRIEFWRFVDLFRGVEATAALKTVALRVRRYNGECVVPLQSLS